MKFFYLLESLKHVKEDINIYLKGLLRHDILNDAMLQMFLNTIYDLNTKGRHIEYSDFSLKEVMDRISDYDYLFKLYIQQCAITHFKYDYQKEILVKFVEREQKFFGEFLLESKAYWKESMSILFYNMDFVWDMEQHYEMVSMILDIALSSNIYLSVDFQELTYALFFNKSDEKRKVIQEFLMQYYHDNITKEVFVWPHGHMKNLLYGGRA